MGKILFMPKTIKPRSFIY